MEKLSEHFSVLNSSIIWKRKQADKRGVLIAG